MLVIELKQWRRGRTIYRELRALAASHEVAWKVAVNSRRGWNNSGHAPNRILTIGDFERLSMPRLT
jgi:hypothetical protein